MSKFLTIYFKLGSVFLKQELTFPFYSILPFNLNWHSKIEYIIFFIMRVTRI